MPIWESPCRKHLERGGPFGGVEDDWTNFQAITFKADQSDFLLPVEPAEHQLKAGCWVQKGNVRLQGPVTSHFVPQLCAQLLAKCESIFFSTERSRECCSFFFFL